MESFKVFSTLHVAMLMVVASTIVAAIAVRRRRRADAPPSRTEKHVAIAYVGLWIGTYIGLHFTSGFDPASMYPLQMCHWCAVIAATSLAFPRRALRAVAYFCGLGLCTQALITPSLTEGPALYPFWFFWISHGMVLGVPIYDVFARGYRPGWRDYGIACVAAIGYVAIALAIDLATGWNYGFVGPGKPDTPSLVDFLGPWPGRLALIVLLAAAAMFVLLIPWLARARYAHPVGEVALPRQER
ncbi:MAG TPA: TIGR02206 family membrane protein [Casimicrobiaceae bacterium]|nr:TIGR02206 family membrane protein [Casimicrobiaceae bacterium]